MGVTSWKSWTCQWKWRSLSGLGSTVRGEQRTTSLDREDTCSWNTMWPCEAAHKEPSCEDLLSDNTPAKSLRATHCRCCYQSKIKGESHFSVLPLPLSFARSRESKGYPNSHFDRGVGLRARGRYPLKPSIFASLLETKGYPEHTAQPATMSARSSRESHFRLK